MIIIETTLSVNVILSVIVSMGLGFMVLNNRFYNGCLLYTSNDRCLIDIEQLSTPSQEIIDLFIQVINYYKY